MTGPVFTPSQPLTLLPWDDPSFEAQRARARYWLSSQRQRETVNPWYSAGELKHAAEGHWPGAQYRGCVGVPALLAEAGDLGFKISGEGRTARLNVASPLVLPPAGPCFCTETPTQICKTCIRERSARFLDDPGLWRRLARERTAAEAQEFARRWYANEALSDEEKILWQAAT